MEIRTDRRAARDRPIDPHGGHRDPGGTLVEVVADLGLIAAQEALAGVAHVDAPLAPHAADVVEHRAELGVGECQRGIVTRPAGRKNREDPPMAHPLGDEHLAESLELRHEFPRHAGHHVARELRFAQHEPQGLQRTVVTLRMAAEPVVLAFESVEADRHRAQAGPQQRLEPCGRQGHAVGDHSPRIAAPRDLGTCPLEVLAHEHLASRDDDQHIGRIDMRGNLLVEYTQEILDRHIRHTGIDATVAAAVAAREVAPQRTLPEERIETVFAHLGGIKVGEEIEGQAFAQPDAATGHRLPLLCGIVRRRGFGIGRRGLPCRSLRLDAERIGPHGLLDEGIGRSPHAIHQHEPRRDLPLRRIGRRFGRSFRCCGCRSGFGGFAPFVGGPAARLLNRGTGRRKAQKGQQREFQTFAQNHGDRIFSYGNKYTNFFRMTKKRPKKF